jgi:hypothetical protein
MRPGAVPHDVVAVGDQAVCFRDVVVLVQPVDSISRHALAPPIVTQSHRSAFRPHQGKSRWSDVGEFSAIGKYLAE